MLQLVCQFAVLGFGLIIIPISPKADRVPVRKGLALPRASHSGEIAQLGSRHLHSAIVAAQVLFAHAVVTEIEIDRIARPTRDDGFTIAIQALVHALTHSFALCY